MFKSIASALRLFYDVYVRQFRTIIHDGGLVIFFLFLPLAYPVIYSLIYNPELVRDVKVVVVDHDRTPESRKLVQRFDATQGVSVLGYAADLGEGRRAMNSHHCYGIMEIPAGYGRKLGQGAKSPVVLYCEMSLLLRYRAMLISATETQLALGAEIQAQEIDNAVPMGASFRIGDPMPIENIDIGVTQGGFDSFIMIGVLVFILHQCIVLSVAMMGGAYRERPELFYMNPFARPRPVLLSMLARVLVVMTIIVGPICFLIHYVPLMFAFPMAGNPFQIFAFLLPMVIACCFLGECVQALVRQREDVFVIWVATSLMLVFLSGLTWPRFAMSGFWKAVGDLFPATWGMEGFVRMNTDGATLNQVADCYYALWIQAVAYGLLAYLTQRFSVVPDVKRGLIKRALIQRDLASRRSAPQPEQNPE